MKNYAAKISLFIVSVFLVLFVSVPSTSVFAAIELAPPQQEGMLRVETATSGGSPDIKKRSEYVLPYPGILHNHPLYFLKDFRDRVIELLIVDPVRKSEFYLLQADKWIASVSSLISAGEIATAQRVFDQAAGRMRLAVVQLEGLKKDGRQIPSGSIDTINNAIEKHLEIVDELSVEKKVSTDQARALYLETQEAVMKLR